MNAVVETPEEEKQKWISAQLIALLYARAPTAIALSVVNAGILIFVFRDAIAELPRLVWFVTILVVAAARMMLWYRYRAAAPPADKAAVWGVRFAAGSAITGLQWAAAAILFFVPGDPALQGYLAVAVGGMAAGALLALGMYPPAYYAFSTPTLTALVARFLIEGGEVPVALGLLIAAFGVTFFWIAGSLRRDYARSFALRFDNVDLMGIISDANEKARSADLAKAAFLGSISHELRTPLNAIIGFSEILKDEMFGDLGQPQYRDYARLIHNSAEHLLDVINEILDISDAESGKLKLSDDDVDMDRLVTVCVNLVVARAGDKAAKITTTIEPHVANLRADARRVRQILLNLLSNAIKFTPRDGAIEVRLTTDPERRVVLAVRDTGIGMTADDVARAVQPFGSGDARLSRRFAGAGIGLPLTKALVELHGGDLSVESAPGAGTTVTVRFPKERMTRGRDGAPA